MSIVIFIIILGILVLVHELGHFIVAKKNGVLVEEFGVGYPPRIAKIKFGETIYSLNLVPLGGFVKLYGEERQEKIKPELEKRSFVAKKPWQKTFVIVAGIFGNFLLGWILISYLFTQGVPTPTNKVIIEQIKNNTPASRADIKPKDIVVRIIDPNQQSHQITTADDLVNLTKKYSGKSIIVEIDRQGLILKKKIVPRVKPPSGEGALGIIITSFIEKKFVWYQAPFYGLVEAFNITRKIIVELLKTVFLLITLKKPQVEVAGPIGIAHFTGQVVKFGKNAVLELMALLSLNLAVINLLPFPALDGGRLVFVIYEWVTRKKINKNFEKYLNLAGFIILLTLAAVVSVNDIIKIYK